MSGTPLWRRYLRFWGDDPAADVDEEFAFHLQTRIDELVAEGWPARAARDEALRGFGDIEMVKRACTELAQGQVRAVRRTEWWTGWRQDVRYALRQLRVSPMLTAVLILTLALGISATVASFSVLYAVVLRPLPFDASDRMVFVWETWREFDRGNASAGHFHDWSEQTTTLEHTTALTRASFNLADGEPERVSGTRATPGYFKVVHIRPALGRYFTRDDVDAGSRVVVLGHGLWRRRFGSDPSIVGRTIRLNGEGHTVIGVAPSEYEMTPTSPQLWTPLVFSPQQRTNYGAHMFTVMATLKPGVTREAAQADLARVTRGIAQREPKNTEGRSVRLESYSDVLLGEFRMPLYLLLTSVVLVLLIGCVNVSNLLLARATSRRRELAIRSAIGGGRWRIIRQLLTESLVLAAAGGAAGVALSYLWIPLFVEFAPAVLPRLADASIDPAALAFAVGVTAATGLVFGLAPAFRAARENVLTTLREGGRSSMPGSARDRVRATLVVAEIALAVLLMVGAGLFIRSGWRLQNVPLGFEPAGTLVARVALPPERYRPDAAVADAYRRMLEDARALPGIRYAGGSTGIPLTGGGADAGTQIEGKPFTPGSALSPAIRLITDQYVEAMGIPLRRGRTLQPSDLAPGAAPVVLINERLAAIAWPGEDPIGKRLSTWTAQPEVPEWREVVGIVGDVRSLGLDEPPTPELFLPYTQPPPMSWNTFQRSLALVVRTDGDPASQAPSLRRAVWSVDSSLPLFGLQTMEELIASRVAGARFSTWVLSLLAAAGLLLAGIGIYGVIAFFVTQRTPEIGLRMALGASRRDVLTMVLKHGTALAILGVALGLIGAFGLTRLVRTLLFEITPTDAPSYAAGTALLLLVAFLACVIPAMRALRVDPIRSLNET